MELQGIGFLDLKGLHRLPSLCPNQFGWKHLCTRFPRCGKSTDTPSSHFYGRPARAECGLVTTKSIGPPPDPNGKSIVYPTALPTSREANILGILGHCAGWSGCWEEWLFSRASCGAKVGWSPRLRSQAKMDRRSQARLWFLIQEARSGVGLFPSGVIRPKRAHR